MLRKQIPDPQVLVIKAFDPSTKETVGLAIWLLFDGTEMSAPIEDATASTKKGERSIAEVLSEEAQRIRSYWMTGKKFMRQSFPNHFYLSKPELVVRLVLAGLMVVISSSQYARCLS